MYCTVWYNLLKILNITMIPFKQTEVLELEFLEFSKGAIVLIQRLCKINKFHFFILIWIRSWYHNWTRLCENTSSLHSTRLGCVIFYFFIWSLIFIISSFNTIILGLYIYIYICIKNKIFFKVWRLLRTFNSKRRRRKR